MSTIEEINEAEAKLSKIRQLMTEVKCRDLIDHFIDHIIEGIDYAIDELALVRHEKLEE